MIWAMFTIGVQLLSIASVRTTSWAFQAANAAALIKESMLATMQGDPEYYKVCGAIFGLFHTFGGTRAGSDLLTGGGGTPSAQGTCWKKQAMDGRPMF